MRRVIMTEEIKTREDMARQALIERLWELTAYHPAQRRILALLTTAASVARDASAADTSSAANFERAKEWILEATAHVWMELDPEKHLRPFNE
jgi:hypothetical protein